MEQKNKRLTFDSPFTSDDEEEILQVLNSLCFDGQDPSCFSFKNEVKKALEKVEKHLVTPELMLIICKYNILPEDVEKLKKELFSKHKKEIIYRICKIFEM